MARLATTIGRMAPLGDRAFAILKHGELPDFLSSLTERIDQRYRDVEVLRRAKVPSDAIIHLGPRQRFVATVSSFSLRAALGDDEEASVSRILGEYRISALLELTLGRRIAIDLDAAWVRRQYAPARYPPLHAPHAWHQDGALDLDFSTIAGEPGDEQALLDMCTCWIALAPCGLDAPGLEFIDAPVRGVVPVHALSDDALRGRFAPHAFVQPKLAAGDALLFSGAVLHRTHVTADMRSDRTSIELRFFPADKIPGRLSQDRFLVVA